MAGVPQPSSLTLEPNPFEQSFASKASNQASPKAPNAISSAAAGAAHQQALSNGLPPQQDPNGKLKPEGIKPIPGFDKIVTPLPLVSGNAGPFQTAMGPPAVSSPAQWIQTQVGPFTPSIVGVTPHYEGYLSQGNLPVGPGLHQPQTHRPHAAQGPLPNGAAGPSQSHGQPVPGQNHMLIPNQILGPSGHNGPYPRQFTNMPLESPGVLMNLSVPPKFPFSPMPPVANGHPAHEAHSQHSPPQPGPGPANPAVTGLYLPDRDRAGPEAKPALETEGPGPKKRAKMPPPGEKVAAFDAKRLNPGKGPNGANGASKRAAKTGPGGATDEPGEADGEAGKIMLEGSEDERRKQFLERNRIAAVKCRQRKKQWVDELKNKVDTYSHINEELQNKNMKLEHDMSQLMHFILRTHSLESLPGNVATIVNYHHAQQSAHDPDPVIPPHSMPRGPRNL